MTRPLLPCGTTAAYRRHKRAKEDVCAPCQAAWDKYQREYQADYRLLNPRRKKATP